MSESCEHLHTRLVQALWNADDIDIIADCLDCGEEDLLIVCWGVDNPVPSPPPIEITQ